jgi:hypothetical protein
MKSRPGSQTAGSFDPFHDLDELACYGIAGSGTVACARIARIRHNKAELANRDPKIAHTIQRYPISAPGKSTTVEALSAARPG